MDVIRHIAPPNWHTYCGLTPTEDRSVLAYDTCSLPDGDENDPATWAGWCPECVRLLLEEEDEEGKVIIDDYSLLLPRPPTKTPWAALGNMVHDQIQLDLEHAASVLQRVLGAYPGPAMVPFTSEVRMPSWPPLSEDQKDRIAKALVSPAVHVRSQTQTPPLVDVISRDEIRMWLVFVEGCEAQEDGSEVWYGGFESCGEDPLDDEKTARAKQEHEVKVAEVEAEQRRVIAEAQAAGRPPPSILQAAPLWPEFPETWVDYVQANIGWAGMLHIGPGADESERDWLLREGIAPGQPFLVRFYGFRPAQPDYWGEYDGDDWNIEILAKAPPTLPGVLAAELCRSWANAFQIKAAVDPICAHGGCYMFAPDDTAERITCEQACRLLRRKA